MGMQAQPGRPAGRRKAGEVCTTALQYLLRGGVLLPCGTGKVSGRAILLRRVLLKHVPRWGRFLPPVLIQNQPPTLHDFQHVFISFLC